MPDPPKPTSVRDQIIATHDITKRSVWGATGPWKPLVADWDFDSIVVHHSGNAGDKDPLAIQEKHKDKNFDDVGYHYMIHPNGTVYEGRDITFKGEHVGGTNTKKIGVLMMGDYDEQILDLDDDDLTQTHVNKLKSLCETLKGHFPIQKFGGHQEFMAAGATQCPGNLIMDKIPSLRTELGLQSP
ncbi:N-acetylmuramoyl-L-alanine amidase [Rubripirellula tenax]|uniref:N-acetylmuramoyl-L-alanine amidase n=1 Tax=Rubripirellula tenax TaxID=2528015 RepID=A0A5C6FDZ4_9BACT|nr:peptidoglycan recognition family protein [Rubripirellula tenax]TWU58972.1 N-acetylmuramoyl-L-alanine amidase [Rubripirellula tenax]